MSSTQFKVINQNNAGSGIKFGGDDLDKTHALLNGQVGYLPITLRSQFGVEDAKFFIEDPITGKKVFIRTGSLANDQDFYLPVGEGLITNTLRNIFVNEQVFQKWIDFKFLEEPVDPDINHIRMWADMATGKLMVKGPDGVPMIIFADISEVINYGTEGFSIYDSTSGSVVRLRGLKSISSAIVITHNPTTHNLELALDPAQIDFEDIGGTLLASQVPQLSTTHMPAAVVLDTEDVTFTGQIKFDKRLEMKLQSSHQTPSAGYNSLYALESDKKLYWRDSSGVTYKVLYNTDLGGTVPLPTEGKLVGYWDGTGVQGTGLLNDMYSQEDIARIDYHDLVTGRFGQEWGSDSDDATCGLASNKRNLVYRDVNPKLTVRFGVDVAGVSNQTQIFIGWASDTAEIQFDDDNPLDSISGFMMGKRAADTNYQIIRNDGSGSQMVDNTGGLPAPDTGIHTLYIEGDNNNDRWGMSFDGGAITWKTDEDPIEEKLLGLVAFITPEGASTAIRKIRLLDITLIRDQKS